jgi:hypothetical protein
MHPPTGNHSETPSSPKVPILSFLQLKKPLPSSSKASINSLDTAPDEQYSSLLLPQYSFVITAYTIAEHVEYSITLKEEFSVLRRKVSRSYCFSTRYSKLERLDERLGGMGLPKKRWFGNTSVEFVEKRKIELEKYLNKIACCSKAEVYKFVKQIKDGDFNHGFKLKFSIM